jgi:hypothetical protein
MRTRGVCQGPPGPLGVDLSSPPAVLGGPETGDTSTNLKIQKGTKIHQEDTKTTTVLRGDKGYRDICNLVHVPILVLVHVLVINDIIFRGSSLNHPHIGSGRRLADSKEEACSAAATSRAGLHQLT